MINRPDIDIFLLIGQSNALGLGDISFAPNPSGDCFEYISTGKVIPMRKYLEMSRGNGTIAPQFAIDYMQLINRTICFIHFAVDGSMIKNWVHDRYSYYADAINKFKSCINYLSPIYNVKNKFAIWIQGESDAKYGTDPIYYSEMLNELVNKLVKNSIEKVFVSLTGYWSGVPDKRVYNIIAAQYLTSLTNKNLVIAADTALSFRDRGLLIDDVHYSQDALNELGSVIAKNVCAYISLGKIEDIDIYSKFNKNICYIEKLLEMYNLL